MRQHGPELWTQKRSFATVVKVFNTIGAQSRGCVPRRADRSAAPVAATNTVAEEIVIGWLDRLASTASMPGALDESCASNPGPRWRPPTGRCWRTHRLATPDQSRRSSGQSV